MGLVRQPENNEMRFWIGNVWAFQLERFELKVSSWNWTRQSSPAFVRNSLNSLNSLN